MTESSAAPTPIAPDPTGRGPGTAARHRPSTRTWVVLGAVLLAQLLIALLAVLPQLSPRVSGTEVQLRVAPVDPIDPFRGAYVDLGYPDLPDPTAIDFKPTQESEDRGLAFVPLIQDGEVWVGGPIQRSDPGGLYLRCDDEQWRLRCGIESWFVGQSEARAIEQRMLNSGAVATIRVDRWGNATIVALEPERD